MNKEKLNDNQVKEAVKKQFIINHIFYKEELQNYTEDEKEINKRLIIIKESINNLDDNLLNYKKEDILKNKYLLDIMGHCFLGEYDPYDLDEERLDELIGDYNKINECFIDNGIDKTLEMVEQYGTIISKDENGFYLLDDNIVNKVIENNEFYISDKRDKEHIKDEIFNTWENQKEILTQDSLNNYSEARNGINFKHFIFCEEYIKRGKIKPTCEHLGISRNTAYLWLKDEKVQDYLKSRQEEIKQETDNTFLATFNSCFSELHDMVNSNYIENGDKIKAIDVFLKHYENLERLKQPNIE